MTTPTPAQISAVLAYLPTFRRGPTAAEVEQFVEALYANSFVQPYNWGAWQQKAIAYCDAPASVRRVGLMTLVQLLTLHVRKERFCEGHLNAMIESGHLLAILERLAELAAG